MLTLIQKELRGLLAFVWLIVAINLVLIGFSLATSAPDQHPFSASRLVNDSGSSFLVLIFSLMLGAGLLVRESEEETLSFLDALPVSRTRVFTAKYIAGVLVLLLIPLGENSYDLLCAYLSHSSTDPSLPGRFLGAFFSAEVIVSLYCLAVALALSFVRQWLALVAGLIVWGFAWLTASGHRWHESLNPMTLDNGLSAAGTPLPWRQAGILAGTTLFALVIAWFCFQHIGSRGLDTLDRLRRGRLGRMLLVGAKLLAPVVWILAITTAMKNADRPKKSGNRPLDESVFAHHETAHYDFLFREGQRELAKDLFDSADEILDDLVSDVGLPSLGAERLVVDLASRVQQHAAGMTNWTRIRLPVLAESDADELKLILAHETAHVLANRLGGTKFTDTFRYTQFFNEGLATYAEKVAQIETREKGMRVLVAAAISRGGIPFDALCDNQALSDKRDPTLVYPLGATFVRALVAVGGTDAPARVLGQFPKLGTVQPKSGVVLWRIVIEGAGINFDRVVAAYDEEVAKDCEENKKAIEAFPRLTGAVTLEGGQIVLTPTYTGEKPGKLACMIEHGSWLGKTPEVYKPGEDGKIRIPREEVEGTTLRYMLGWGVKDLPLGIFEPWVETSL